MAPSLAGSVPGRVRSLLFRHWDKRVIDIGARYFNTVGSKEGWTPSTFVSSRTNRHKNSQRTQQQRAEDYMDEEDLADAADVQSLHTQKPYLGFGSTHDDEKRKGLFIDLLKPQGDTVGAKLLRKMGWRDGQGVGPKIRRKARLDGQDTVASHGQETHLFAPEDSQMVKLTRKNDHAGLGYRAGVDPNRDSQPRRPSSDHAESDSGEEQNSIKRPTFSGLQPACRPSTQRRTGGFGVGVLNDDDSGNDDAYDMGPRISYSRTFGGDKKAKKKNQKQVVATPSANPLVKSRPMFRPKKVLESRSGSRKCHDGRLPLEGFLLGDSSEGSAPLSAFQDKHALPRIPESWVSTKTISVQGQDERTYQSAADAARASKLDPKSRAAVLGESQLPGKSVFDYLSPAARDRLVSASGRSKLPEARGGNIPGSEISTDTRTSASSAIPSLGKDIALAALGRGARGWMPYADDEAKRSRYTAFLELQAGVRSELPKRSPIVKQDAWIQELEEFAHAAEVFKPMSGTMASRFTSSSTLPGSQTDALPKDGILSSISKVEKPEDPAESAAKMGMFGAMTRTEHRFYPTRLLCKRFNVKPPAHAGSDPEGGQQSAPPTKTSSSSAPGPQVAEAPSSRLVTKNTGGGMMVPENRQLEQGEVQKSCQGTPLAMLDRSGGEESVDVSHNDALEGRRAGDELFKAIFGDEEDD